MAEAHRQAEIADGADPALHKQNIGKRSFVRIGLDIRKYLTYLFDEDVLALEVPVGYGRLAVGADNLQVQVRQARGDRQAHPEHHF